MKIRSIFVCLIPSLAIAACGGASDDLPVNEHRIAVPSDGLHGHYLPRVRTLPNGNKEVLHLQLSRRGFANYSLMELDCASQRIRDLGDGLTEEEALRRQGADNEFKAVMRENEVRMTILGTVCGGVRR